MEKYEIPISTLNRILQSQESILNIVDSQASLYPCYRDLAKEIKKICVDYDSTKKLAYLHNLAHKIKLYR